MRGTPGRSLPPGGHPRPVVRSEITGAHRPAELRCSTWSTHGSADIPKEAIDTALCSSIEPRGRPSDHGFGISRSATIGLLYLLVYTDTLPTESLAAVEEAYRRIYPSYRPSRGMRGFLEAHWEEYVRKGMTTVEDMIS